MITTMPLIKICNQRPTALRTLSRQSRIIILERATSIYSYAYLERAAKGLCHRTVQLALSTHLFKVLLKLGLGEERGEKAS